MAQTIVSLAKAFGMAVRDARINANLTQEQLAHRAGVHRTYIGDLENGRKSPTLDVVEALAGALERTAHELIAEAEGRARTPNLASRQAQSR